MTLAEATRQYQAALEARRGLRAATEGSAMFDIEHEAADHEVARAEGVMFKAWAARL